MAIGQPDAFDGAGRVLLSGGSERRRIIHDQVISKPGTSVSVSPCGRYVMAGGSPSGYPEHRGRAAWASLVEVQGLPHEIVRLHTRAD